MVLFFTCFAVSILIALVAFLVTKEVTLPELLCIAGVQLVIAGASVAICYWSNTSDTETWNGTVADKQHVTVSCSHSYQCHPHPCSCDSKGQNCSTCYDTCYEHSHDYDWDVHTSNGETISIDRVDRQGVDEPPRWSAVRIGEPTSVMHTYESYIKAAPGSLFRHQGLEAKYANLIPGYPSQIYDYYKLNRLVLVNGASVSDDTAWNDGLMKLNASLGAYRQANIIVVVAQNLPHDYYDALEEAWIGGKKNDIVLVVDVDSTGAPVWTSVMAWTVNPLFKVKLRDAIMALPRIDHKPVIAALDVNIEQYHHRKPMADFEYLKSMITPSTTQWIITLILSILVDVALTFYFYNNDPFDGGNTFRSRRITFGRGHY